MKVWDGFIRFFHWSLVLCIAGLYFSAEEGAMELHFVLAYITLALLATRLLWGLFGSESARLRKLLHSPKAVFRALRQSEQVAGHNAAGSYMVLLFFGLLLVQLLSGLMTTDDILTDGPLVQYVSYDWVEWASSVHHQNFDFILAAIALHIAAIVIYALKGKRLVPAMITGRNNAMQETAVVKPAWPAFVVFAAILAALLCTWGYEPLVSLI